MLWVVGLKSPEGETSFRSCEAPDQQRALQSFSIECIRGMSIVSCRPANTTEFIQKWGELNSRKIRDLRIPYPTKSVVRFDEWGDDLFEPYPNPLNFSDKTIDRLLPRQEW